MSSARNVPRSSSRSSIPQQSAVDPAAAQGWIRLDDTDLYAYPLTLRDTLTPGARHPSSTPATLPWNTTREGGP